MIKSIHEINLQLIDFCNLNCKFCINSNINEKIPVFGIMQLDVFKSIVNKCIDGGVTKFCLTPRCGEVLLDPTLINKLQYLESLPSVKEYYFATNLTICSKELFSFLNTSNKCHIQISYYGDLYTKFNFNTNGSNELYQEFIQGLTNILHIQDKSKIRIYQRFSKLTKQLPIIDVLCKLGCIYDVSETLNFNIGGYLKNDVDEFVGYERVGNCPTKQIGSILINGDYNLCYMNDVYNETSQGNIFDTTLTELRANAKLDGWEICKRCNENWDENKELTL